MPSVPHSGAACPSRVYPMSHAYTAVVCVPLVISTTSPPSGVKTSSHLAGKNCFTTVLTVIQETKEQNRPESIFHNLFSLTNLTSQKLYYNGICVVFFPILCTSYFSIKQHLSRYLNKQSLFSLG